MAERVNIGIAGFVPEGVWSASKQYEKCSVVRYGAGVYVAKQANTNVAPGVNLNWENYWMLAVSDGASIESVSAGEPVDNGEGFTETPVTISASSGFSDVIRVLAKNGNAGVSILNRTVTLSSSGWTGSASPYSQTVSVSGVTADSFNIISAPVGTAASALEMIYNANLQDGGQAENSITFLCYGNVPSENISVRVTIVVPSEGGADVEQVYADINNTDFGG